MNAGAHAQLGGISGGGKTVLLNCYLATWLAKGAELAIIDLPTKSADFEWCKDFVRPGGWGCASPAQSAVAIRLIMDEGERRSAHIKAHGVNDWKLLPKNAALKPLVVIVDELTGLFALEAVPKAGKDAPQLLKDMADDANRTNLFKEILKNGIKRVAAELRFTGVFLMLATQVASANTGIDPSLRTNLHHKLLMGAKPTEGNRRLVFSDPERVPLVPENVRTGGGASRGVGSTEPEGDEPSVFGQACMTPDAAACSAPGPHWQSTQGQIATGTATVVPNDDRALAASALNDRFSALPHRWPARQRCGNDGQEEVMLAVDHSVRSRVAQQSIRERRCRNSSRKLGPGQEDVPA